MGYYEIKRIEPWLYSIYDPMSVYCYLAVGGKGALLYDTAFGIGGLNEAVREITDKPLTVVLGHAHIDHANGAFQFASVYLGDRDLELFDLHTSAKYRKDNADRLAESGIGAPPGFDPEKYIAAGAGSLAIASLKPGAVFDLGGLAAEAVAMEGHTAGSIGLLFRDKKTLLVSDAANAHVWMFLPESLPLREYAAMLDRVYRLDFDVFYTGHGNAPQPKPMLLKYKAAALNAAVAKSAPYNQFPALKPYLYSEGGVDIVFSEDKL